MIAQDQMIPDDFGRSIGGFLAEFRKQQAGTRRDSDSKTDLIEKLKDSVYIEFQGRPRRHHIQRVGESNLHWVHKNKRGHLRRFRGKLIRILIIARGHELTANLTAAVQGAGFRQWVLNT